MASLMVSSTPWEYHEVYDDAENVWPVWVKRDDLCCKLPGPPYSKMRGLELYLNGLDEKFPIGVQDAGYHSRSGWGTAYLCDALGFDCHVFYPVYKRDGGVENHELREYQVNAHALGAMLIPQKAGRASMLWYQARKWMVENTDGGIMLPAGLKLQENAIGTSREVLNHTPDMLWGGTWICAISSGTTMAGIVLGLKEIQEDVDFIAYMGSSKNEDKTRKHMCAMAGYEPDNLMFIDEGWDYRDAETRPMPFPGSVYYEGKAWYWLIDNIHNLEQPVIFWNIGD